MSNNRDGTPTAGHVDQIREIIFGEQIRQYDDRFSDLEARFAKRLEDVRGTIEKAAAAREKALTKQVETLKERLKAERADRAADAKAAATELKAVRKQLEASGNSASEHQSALKRLGKEFSAEIKRVEAMVREHDADLAANQEAIGSISRQTVDRDSLAQVLDSLAASLRVPTS